MTAKYLIEFDRISVMRGDTVALDNISLKIGAGEHVAILGPNGCGKSTFVKTITRECYPVYDEDASLRIMGEERWNIFELREKLGIVSTDLMNALTRRASALEIVVSGFFSSIGLWPYQQITDDMIERGKRALTLMGAIHLADRTTNELSTGEARRVLLARALVHEPQTLLLDEPSVALDLGAQHDLRSRIRKLAQSGIGIVMVTHHLADLIPEMQRILLMKNGKIIADGPPSKVLVESELSNLFGVPLRLTHRDGYYSLW